jgi:hypothetical protein
MPTAEKTYAMLGNEDLWETAKACSQALTKTGVAHVVCGGVAVCLQCYRRNTTDLDLVIRSEDSQAMRCALEQIGLSWDTERAEFRTTGGVAIQFLLAGERAGRGEEGELPDPVDPDVQETIEGLPTLRLAKLIEIKIACGTANLRRTHKDFADVVELIAIRNLGGDFSRFLHKSVRKTFRELVRNAKGE